MMSVPMLANFCHGGTMADCGGGFFLQPPWPICEVWWCHGVLWGFKMTFFAFHHGAPSTINNTGQCFS
jgi:hypothetical protein